MPWAPGPVRTLSVFGTVQISRLAYFREGLDTPSSPCYSGLSRNTGGAKLKVHEHITVLGFCVVCRGSGPGKFQPTPYQVRREQPKQVIKPIDRSTEGGVLDIRTEYRWPLYCGDINVVRTRWTEYELRLPYQEAKKLNVVRCRECTRNNTVCGIGV